MDGLSYDFFEDDLDAEAPLFEGLSGETDLMSEGFGETDGYDLEDAEDFEDFEDFEDEWLSDVASGVAAGANWAWNRYGKKAATARWGEGSGKDRKLTGNRKVAADIVGDILGSLAKHSTELSGFDGDGLDAEDEFIPAQIGHMEAIAATANGDPRMAADEMVRTAFGITRKARSMQPAAAALRADAARVMAIARRDPSRRVLARLAPLALRRTAVALSRRALAGAPPSPELAVRVFRSVLSALARNNRLRSMALARSDAARRMAMARRSRGAMQRGW